MSLAEKLHAIRVSANLTQADLSARIGLSQGAISHIERGTHGISSDALESWAKACGTEVTFVGPAHEENLRLMAALPPRRLALLVRLAQLLPRLEQAHIVTLEGIVDTWFKVASFADEDTPAPRGIVKKM